MSRRPRARLAPLLLALAAAATGAAACATAGPRVTREDALRAAHGWPARVDWDAAGAEATRVLGEYIRVRTVNPPGNEAEGAAFLARVLEAEGIASEIVELAPGRASIIARLEATAPEPGAGALCLMSHIDVVPVEADKWQHPDDAFSGRLDEQGTIWGRGALDMKALGVMELLSVAWLQRLGVPLKRDVVLIGVADEEVDNLGVIQLAKQWERIGCTHALNEGGLGVVDAVFEGQTVYTISTGEKGNLWLKLTAHGKAGHGSVDRDDEAIDVLLTALERIRRGYHPSDHPPALYSLLASMGEQRGAPESVVLASSTLVDELVAPDSMENPLTRSGMTNTIHLTGLRTPEAKPNVVSSEASAILDCRLLPGTPPEAMLARIKALAGGDLDLSYEVLLAQPGNESPVDDDLYRALARQAVAGRTDVAVGPVISVGSTDSLLLRPIGVRAYGFTPIEITREEAATMHGADERISARNLREGLRILFAAVTEFAAAGPPQDK